MSYTTSEGVREDSESGRRRGSTAQHVTAVTSAGSPRLTFLLVVWITGARLLDSSCSFSGVVASTTCNRQPAVTQHHTAPHSTTQHNTAQNNRHTAQHPPTERERHTALSPFLSLSLSVSLCLSPCLSYSCGLPPKPLIFRPCGIRAPSSLLPPPASCLVSLYLTYLLVDLRDLSSGRAHCHDVLLDLLLFPE